MLGVNAVIYARVSTSKQAEEELPIEGQLDRCRRKAAELGAAVMREFVDNGISGTTDQRPAFQDAIDFCHTFTPTYFITWSTSRFARNKVDAGLYKLQLEKIGVRPVYVSQDFDASTDGGWLLESVLEIFDDHYSRQVSADTKRSMIKNAEDGYFNGGKAPYGYEAVQAPDNPKRRVLRPDPIESEIVREMFQMRARGVGAGTIADTLRRDGITNRGRQWRKQTILNLFRNEALRGRVVFNRLNRRTKKERPREEWIIIDSHQPIIDEGLWNLVQRSIADDAPTIGHGGHNSAWLFTGLLHCGECGLGMMIETSRGRSKLYSYYNCSKWQKLKQCRNHRLRADDLEAWLIERIAGDIFTDDNLAGLVKDLNQAAGQWARENRRRRKTLSDRLATYEARNGKLFEVLEHYGKNAPNLGDMTQRLRNNNRQIKHLKEELAALAAEQPPKVAFDRSDISGLRSFLVQSIKNPDNPRNIREFLRSFIAGIYIEGGAVNIKYEPFALVSSAQNRGTSGAQQAPAGTPV